MFSASDKSFTDIGVKVVRKRRSPSPGRDHFGEAKSNAGHVAYKFVSCTDIVAFMSKLVQYITYSMLWMFNASERKGVKL